MVVGVGGRDQARRAAEGDAKGSWHCRASSGRRSGLREVLERRGGRYPADAHTPRRTGEAAAVPRIQPAAVSWPQPAAVAISFLWRSWDTALGPELLRATPSAGPRQLSEAGLTCPQPPTGNSRARLPRGL